MTCDDTDVIKSVVAICTVEKVKDVAKMIRHLECGYGETCDASVLLQRIL